jgi:hypothetical protein
VSLGENKNSATFRVSVNSNIQGVKTCTLLVDSSWPFLSVLALLDARHIFVNSFIVSISFSPTTTHTTLQETHDKSGECMYLERRR